MDLQRFGMKVNPWVFYPAALLIGGVLIPAVTYPEALRGQLATIQKAIEVNFGWFFVLSVTLFLGFVVWLLLSPYGNLRLGEDHERPRYSRTSWFAMLFSAGMGIGLLFFGVYEPIHHFAQPPLGEGETLDAARQAMEISFFHWGFHAWAIYIVVGLSVAFFAYRHNRPLTIRTGLYPILGEATDGPIGHLVDVIAVFGTLFGVATSLTFGTAQVSEGLAHLSLVENNTQTQLWLIAVITLAATISVATGVNRGIRRLSELNIIGASLLLLFVLFAGPTAFLLSSFVQDVGHYLVALPELSFRTYAWAAENEEVRNSWFGDWSLFYWGWWISWAPFVGMFIARVSRGRTIREFVLGVLLVPTLLTGFWFSVFGNSALHLEISGATDLVAIVMDQNEVPKALYVFLEQLPFPKLTTVFATLVLIVFFVTSSDSGSLVIDIITSDGDPHPPVGQRIFWSFLEGTVAAVLLTLGGTEAMQVAVLLMSLPFCLVMVMMCLGLAKTLPKAHRLAREKKAIPPVQSPSTSREPSRSTRPSAPKRTPSTSRVTEPS